MLDVSLETEAELVRCDARSAVSARSYGLKLGDCGDVAKKRSSNNLPESFLLI